MIEMQPEWCSQGSVGLSGTQTRFKRGNIGIFSASSTDCSSFVFPAPLFNRSKRRYWNIMSVGTRLQRRTGPELSVFCLLTIIIISSPALGSVQSSYPQNTDCVSGKGKGCLGIHSLFNMLPGNKRRLTLCLCCRYCTFVVCILKMEIQAWPLEAYEMQAV